MSLKTKVLFAIINEEFPELNVCGVNA